jgi:hypothetical protein
VSNAERLRGTRGNQRWYEWRGERYWSVTTIISGGLPKPVLVPWAKKYTAEYAVDNFKKLGALLEPDESGQVDRQGAVDWLKGAAFRERDRAGDMGNAVHKAVEAYVLGKPMPKWPPIVAARMKAFEQYLSDYEPEYETGMAEAPVFSRTQRYAGTLDNIVKIDGRRLIKDTKGGKGVYPEVGLQLAAYRYAEFIGLPDGSEQPMPPVDGAVVLHLPEAGGYELVDVRADEEIFRSFLYVREVFRFQDEMAKTVLRGPLGRAVSDADVALRLEVGA